MRLPGVYEIGDRVQVTTPEATGEGWVSYQAGTPAGRYNIRLDDHRDVLATKTQMTLVQAVRKP